MEITSASCELLHLFIFFFSPLLSLRLLGILTVLRKKLPSALPCGLVFPFLHFSNHRYPSQVSASDWTRVLVTGVNLCR